MRERKKNFEINYFVGLISIKNQKISCLSSPFLIAIFFLFISVCASLCIDCDHELLMCEWRIKKNEKKWEEKG